MKLTKYFIYYLDRKLEMHSGSTYFVGRTRETQIRLPNTSVSRKHAQIAWKDDGFVVTDLESTNGTQINGTTVDEARLYDGDKIKIGDFNLQFVAHEVDLEDVENNLRTLGDNATIRMEQQLGEILRHIDDPELARKVFELKRTFENRKDQLSDLANHDKLTGLFNRRAFDEQLSKEVNRAHLINKQLSLIMIDIDHFKLFNDRYGHQKGDEVLATVAETLMNNARGSDTAARYGGEEMALILENTTLAEAGVIAERIRMNVQQDAQEVSEVELTISLGVAGLSADHDTPERLIRAADDALYDAKENGRNQVVLAALTDPKTEEPKTQAS
jgi:diguanylate cyclase (GGDEF)-like protein